VIEIRLSVHCTLPFNDVTLQPAWPPARRRLGLIGVHRRPTTRNLETAIGLSKAELDGGGGDVVVTSTDYDTKRSPRWDGAHADLPIARLLKLFVCPTAERKRPGPVAGAHQSGPGCLTEAINRHRPLLSRN